MKTIKLAPGERLVTNQLNRKGVLPQNIVDAARDIVANVRANGDAAVRDYCQRFDGVELQSFRLPQEQIDAALEGLDPAFVAALEKASRQIREFHQREVEQSWFTTRPDGTMLGVKVTPLAAAGIYVPGGRAQYPSTVLMNAIPAKVAGVKRVVMVTPPQKDGLISPYTLAAAKLGGVDEIYMVGGAQAVAALAYGTETIPRVDKITGPQRLCCRCQADCLGRRGYRHGCRPVRGLRAGRCHGQAYGGRCRPDGPGRARSAGSLLSGDLRRAVCA